jgi:MoxR-like ATPase
MQHKFEALRQQLAQSLIERDDEISAILLGVIAQEHVLFVGPPGTAKSTLCTGLCAGIDGARAFPYLMTRHTKPDELFGAVDVLAMSNGQYIRRTAGKLPDCHIAFLDEIWKSSSAIVNTLLTIMQERQFDNDGRQPCPLRLVISASNEWPGGEGQEDMGAVFDRFLIRRTVKPVSEGSMASLLFDDLPAITPCLTLVELDDAHREAMALPFSQDAKDALLRILGDLRAEGVTVGDRRKRKSIKVAQAAAWLAGSAEVEVRHLESLADVLWEDPGEHAKKATEIVVKAANPTGAMLTAMLAEVASILDEQASDAASIAGQIGKLKECEDRAKLLVVNGNGRAKAGLQYVKDQRAALAQRLLAR